VHLRTRDGRRILDLYGGHAVAALGYSHPRWQAALEAQAKSLLFQSNAVPLDVRARAARAHAVRRPRPRHGVLRQHRRRGQRERAQAGAADHGRRKVVAIEGSFHGRTAAAGAVTWGAAKKWYGFPQAPFDVEFVPRGDLEAIARVVGTDTAAVIVEPVQGVAAPWISGSRSSPPCARAAARPARC
jgi:acetylornithine/N-succinyldiaminopimelate aminotransferase